MLSGEVIMPRIVIDTETTGLPSSQYAAPVSIGAVLVSDEGEIVDTFYSLVLPDIIHTGEYLDAQRIHGIPLARLIEADVPSSREATDLLRAWWEKHGRPMLHAYNVSFDELMIRRMGWEPRGYWGDCIQTHASRVMGVGRASLNAAVRHFGLPGRRPDAEHHALEDARLAASVALASGLWR